MYLQKIPHELRKLGLIRYMRHVVVEYSQFQSQFLFFKNFPVDTKAVASKI